MYTYWVAAWVVQGSTPSAPAEALALSKLPSAIPLVLIDVMGRACPPAIGIAVHACRWDPSHPLLRIIVNATKPFRVQLPHFKLRSRSPVHRACFCSDFARVLSPPPHQFHLLGAKGLVREHAVVEIR